MSTSKQTATNWTIADFEETARIIALDSESRELEQRRRREREFAQAAGWQYDRYWETMTLEQLREAQS